MEGGDSAVDSSSIATFDGDFDNFARALEAIEGKERRCGELGWEELEGGGEGGGDGPQLTEGEEEAEVEADRVEVEEEDSRTRIHTDGHRQSRDNQRTPPVNHSSAHLPPTALPSTPHPLGEDGAVTGSVQQDEWQPQMPPMRAEPSLTPSFERTMGERRPSMEGQGRVGEEEGRRGEGRKAALLLPTTTALPHRWSRGVGGRGEEGGSRADRERGSLRSLRGGPGRRWGEGEGGQRGEAEKSEDGDPSDYQRRSARSMGG